jgi:hypothetical protein
MRDGGVDAGKLKIARSERTARAKNPNWPRHIIIIITHREREDYCRPWWSGGRASERVRGVMSSRLHIEPARASARGPPRDEGIKRESSSFGCHGYGPGSPAGEHDRHRVWAERWRCCCCRTSAAQTAYNCSPRTELSSAPPQATRLRHSLMRCHEQKTHTQGPLWVLYYQPGYTGT